MKDQNKTKQQLIDKLVQVRQRGVELKAAGPECKQAEQEIHQRKEDWALIGLLNRAVNRGDTLQEILKLLTKETRRIFSCSGAASYLVSENKAHLVLHRNEILPARLKGRVEKLIGMKIPTEIRVPLKAGSQYLQILESRKPQIANGPETIEKLMGEFAENKILKRLVPEIYRILGIHSVMCAPLIADDQAIGLLDVSRGEPFTESDLRRLESISEQLTGIVARKRAEEALQESEERYRSLVESTEDSVYLVDKMGTYLFMNKNCLSRFDLPIGKVVGRPYGKFHSEEKTNEFCEKLKEVFETGRSVQYEHKSERDGLYFLRTLSPVEDHDGNSTAVTVISKDVTERKRAEELGKRKTALAMLSSAVAQRISSKLELDELLPEIVTAVHEAFEYYSVALFMVDEDAGCLKLQSVAGHSPDTSPKDFRIALGEGMTGYAAVTGETQAAGDVSQDPHYVRKAMEKTASELALHIKRGEKVIGVLDLQSDDYDAFDETDVGAMEALADQIAIAIENAQLFQETQRRTEEMAALRQVTLATLSTLERDQVFEIMLDQLGAVIAYDNAAIKILTPDGREKMIAGRGPIIREQIMWDGIDAKDNKLVQEMRETRWPIVVHDTHTDERFEKVGNWEAFHSWATAPLFVRDNLIGFLVVEKTSSGFFDEKAAQLLADFSHAAAIALENARLYEDVSKELAERKQTEEALQESEERYRSLFERNLAGVYLTTFGGQVLDCNEAFVQILGFDSREEVLSCRALELYYDAADRERFITQLLKQRTLTGYEWCLRRKDGSPIWVLENSNLIPGGDGTPAFLQGTLIDITELKRAEREIRGISQFQESIIDNANVWLNVLDERANIILWNKAAEAISGYSREEVVGHDKIWEWLYPDETYRKRLLDQATRNLATREAVEDLETTIQCKDGQQRIISWDQRNLIGDTGEPIGSIALGRDVTQQKNAEERVQYQADLLQHVSDAIVSTDLEFNVKSWNRAAEEIYGWEAGEVMGKPFHKVTQLEYPHVRMEDVVDKFFKKGFWQGEVIQKHKDGTAVDILASVSLVKDRGGNPEGAVAVSRDITERKRADEALRKSKARCSELVERSKDGIAVIQDGVVKFVNSAATELFGYSLEEVMEKSFLEFIPASSREVVQKRYTDRMAGKEVPSIYEIELLREDGSNVAVELNAGRVELEGKAADLVFIRDITDRKLAAEQLRKALEGTIQAIGLTTETRDPYTAGHQRRVTQLGVAIAKEMGLSQEQIKGIRVAGLVHDIGKMSIPAEILSKPTKLTDLEFHLVQGHPQVAYDILKTIEFPWPVAQIVLQHHERMDGSGYPHGTKGEEIMLEARILAVADVVEAMASFRPYRPALGIDRALEEISQNKGILYDTDVVNACTRLFAEKQFQFED